VLGIGQSYLTIKHPFIYKNLQIKNITMNAIIKEKRKVLQTLSHTAKELAESEGLTVKEYNVNDLIMNFIYNPDKEFVFKSFQSWKKEGYTIKKGSKAYLLWGQPINRAKTNESGEVINEENINEDTPFFPLAYIFRNDQAIKPIKTKQKKPPQPVPEPVADLPL